MVSNCRAAIFDMDGTLLDSMMYWRLVGLEYLIARGMPLPDMSVNELFSVSSREVLRRVHEKHAIEYDHTKVVNEIERRMQHWYLEDVMPKPGAVAMLQRLRELGIPCAVATASPMWAAVPALERHDMLQYFEFVTDTYEVGMGKSDPEFFRIVAGRLGFAPKDCWMFEDAAYAIRGAKAAGMRVCAIEDFSASKDRDEIMQMSDVYICDYAELL